MNNQKIIVCDRCHYFPSKTDQDLYRYIDIAKEKLFWKCYVCQYQHIFIYQSSILLQQSSIVRANPHNILTKWDQDRLSNGNRQMMIIIDGNDSNLQNNAYLIINNPQILSQQLQQSTRFMKNIEQLIKQSEWFAFCYLKINVFNKFSRRNQTKKNDHIKNKLYLIYLLHKYLLNAYQSINLTQINTINIILQYKTSALCFKFNRLSLDQNPQLLEFLQIFSLITKDSKLQYLDLAYKQKIQKRSYQFFKFDTIENILLIGKKYQDLKYIKNIFNIQIKQKQKIFCLNLRKEETKQLSIYPFNQNFILKKMKKNIQKSKQKQQFVTIFYHSIANHQIIYASLNQNQILQINKMFSDRNKRPEEELLILRLKTYLKQTQIKILRLYGQLFINNNKQFIFYLFDWANLQKQIIESFDDVQQSNILLPQDVLEHKFIKSQASNPFAKKFCRSKEYQQEENQEDYQYL